MIIQCDQCKTRFRVADEKMRPEGIKVRCAKCKQIFLATPPPDLQPDSLNQPPAAVSTETAPSTEAAPEETPLASAQTSEESAFSSEFEEKGDDFEDFGFAPFPEEPVPEEEKSAADEDFSEPGEEREILPEEEKEPVEEGSFADLDFGIGPDEEEEEFGDLPAEDDSLTEIRESEETSVDFTFAGKEEPAEEEDFQIAPPPEEEEYRGLFSGSDQAEEEPMFSIEEEAKEDDETDFSFKTEDTEEKDAETKSSPAEPESDSFTMGADERRQISEETAFLRETASGDTGSSPTEKATSSPAPARKSPVATLMVLFLTVLIILTAVTGYLFWKEGPQAFERLLLNVTGDQAQPVVQQGSIELTDYKASFVSNANAGELFVIQGKALNRYNEARSAIQVKGVVYDELGQPVLQQTVFSGNPLTKEQLATIPYAKIEEAMNNQFGKDLSNLNVSPDATIPFTVVFRNLPANMSEFTVEVVDSKPAAPGK